MFQALSGNAYILVDEGGTVVGAGQHAPGQEHQLEQGAAGAQGDGDLATLIIIIIIIIILIITWSRSSSARNMQERTSQYRNTDTPPPWEPAIILKIKKYMHLK